MGKSSYNFAQNMKRVGKLVRILHAERVSANLGARKLIRPEISTNKVVVIGRPPSFSLHMQFYQIPVFQYSCQLDDLPGVTK